MNDDRRKKIKEIISKYEELTSLAEEIKGMIEEARDEEQEYKDNMPQAFQDGGKGERADEVVSQLEYVVDHLDNFIGEDMLDNLNAAVE